MERAGFLTCLRDKERKKDGHVGMTRRGGDEGGEEMALTVTQGVPLKAVHVLLVQQLGQVTAVDEPGLMNGNEAGDQGDE